MSDIVNTLLTWVALFTRAWIEIMKPYNIPQIIRVALFTRAWIEISRHWERLQAAFVALFTRAWIEMSKRAVLVRFKPRRPLHEGVD